MNDFTKEELHVILNSLEWTFPSKQTIETGLMIKKIQTLINSYCNHEYEFRDIGTSEICQKCRKIK